MKSWVRTAFKAFGYEVRRIPPAVESKAQVMLATAHALRRLAPPVTLQRFTVSGIHYEADPCSVGLTPQGEFTAHGAIRMIRERGQQGLHVLDICCGVGIIGLTIFTTLRSEGLVRSVGLADINVFNLNSLRRTLERNGLSALLDAEIRCWLSDGLLHVPAHRSYDLIVSNPPHFFSPASASDLLTPGQLGMFDPQWAFHRAFFERCHEYLAQGGEVWFLENGQTVSEADLLPFVDANPRLRYLGRVDEPLLPGFFWLLVARV